MPTEMEGWWFRLDAYVLDYKFVALGHNTIRGAAGAAILNAEMMHTDGLLAY